MNPLRVDTDVQLGEALVHYLLEEEVKTFFVVILFKTITADAH